jgi:hypothetical protein
VLNQLEQLVSTSETAADELRIAQSEAEEVSGVLLRALADVSQQHGVTPEALFQEEAKALMTCEPVEVRVPLAHYRRLLERAIALTGEPAIGLRAGLYASKSAFDLLAPLVAHVPSLRDGIREIRQFQALFFGGAYLHFSERSGVARLCWEFPRADAASDRCIADFLMAGIVRMLRAFGCGRSDLYAARFEHRKPPYHHVYSSIFQGQNAFPKN